jgi:hypothetical protein
MQYIILWTDWLEVESLPVTLPCDMTNDHVM